MKAYWGIRGIIPRIFDIDTTWRWVVSFTPRPLYCQRKSPRCPLCGRLSGPRNRSGSGGEEKNSQPLPGVSKRSRKYWALIQEGVAWGLMGDVGNDVRYSGDYLDLRGWKLREAGEDCIMYASPNIVRVIRSRRMKLAGHVARMGGWEMQTAFL
jgi:hypothetical protein